MLFYKVSIHYYPIYIYRLLWSRHKPKDELIFIFRLFNYEEPLFRAKDVAEWIEIFNVSQMVQSVDEDEKGIYNVYTLGGNQDVLFLTENGVYEVLMLSRKPVAKEFKKEVKKMLHALRTKKAALMPTQYIIRMF